MFMQIVGENEASLFSDATTQESHMDRQGFAFCGTNTAEKVAREWVTHLPDELDSRRL